MNMKKIMAIVFVVIGLLSVILGLSAFGCDTGYYESNTSYGGDAYTGIQNAAAQTANNVRYITEAVAYVGGSVLLVAGLTLAAVGVKSWPVDESGKLELPKFNIAPAVPVAPVAAPAPQTFCPNCGAAQEQNAGFCASCGTKLN